MRELVDHRTAYTSTWRDSDGSLSVRKYATPQFYKTAKGAWAPIDPSLHPVAHQSGWWRSGANDWSVAFGPAGTQGGAVRFIMGSNTFGLTPQAVGDARRTPSVSGRSATYAGVWPQVDLVEHVATDRVKEDVVVKGAGAPSSFSFRLSGATATPTRAGGVDLVAGGKRVGTIPAPTVTISGNRADQTVTSGVRMTVAGDVVRLSVSPAWLAALPASAFPVTIDPSVFRISTPQSWQTYSVSNDGQVLNGVMQVGQDAAGADWRPEIFVPAPTPPTAAPGEQPWQFAGVSLNFLCDCSVTNPSIFGLPGFSPYADITGGDLLLNAPGDQGSNITFVSGSDAPGWSYLTGRTDGWWLGLGTPDGVSGPNDGSLGTFDPTYSMFVTVYDQQPNPTTITSPATGSVLSTTTPTLTADHLPVDSSGFDTNYYDFKISTSADGTGTVIDSGWLSQADAGRPTAMTWAVPAGSLRDGATYYAKVLTSEWAIYSPDPNFTGSLKPSFSSAVSFTVRQRLGDGGPSPADTVGSPPAGTATPSKGAPSPGTPTASETVNLLNGNLALTVGTTNMQTVSGSAGVSLGYNSALSSVSRGGNYGLTGQYYADSGAHTFTAALAGQRTDGVVDATWKGGEAPVGGIMAKVGTLDKAFLVRWTGVLTLPAGTWNLGGVTSGGMRIFLDGSTSPLYDDWSGAAASTSQSYGSSTVSGSRAYRIEVDNWVRGTFGTTDTVQLWAKNTEITDPDATSAWVVPSGWLAPAAAGVPAGWSLQANPATVQWVRADDQGSQVVLQGVSGETAVFTRQATGHYQSQPGNTDQLNVDGNGRLQLATSDNQLYTFNADGTVASMTSATDDRHPAALQYTYSGTPTLMRGITDPVSGRTIALSYGGDTGCPTTDPAPAGLLCKIGYWDGTTTTFGYNGNGQIASVVNALGQTVLLAYDSDNRLADVRDALASDYVAAGGPAGTPADCPADSTGLSVTPVDTQICYDSKSRVATVVQPAPTPGAARPARSYTYATDHTDVAIAGFSPATGYASRIAYDAQGRVTQQSDSARGATTTVWANATAPNQNCGTTCGTDQQIVTVTPDSEQTSMMYDADGDVTDRYGPAPAACFSGGWPAGAAASGPAQGYLPVSDPQGTTGCGIAAVPHSHDGYDEGLTGLAASFWSNGQAAGPVTTHAYGPGGTQTAALCGATSGRLCAGWAAGSPPIGSDASGQWSLRLTGGITLASAGAYTFGVASSQAVTVSIDGAPVVHDGSDVTGFVAGQTRTTSASSSTDLAAGVHTIQVDFQGSETQLNEFAVSLTPPSGAGAVISNTILGPRYRLKTSTTDADGVKTTTSYADGTLGPQYGLATATTVGAGTGTALTTSIAYEAPGASTYLRKTLRTLPAGNATTYTYYTGTQGPLAAVCGVAANTPQGGQMQAQTDPAPTSGAAARVQQFVYDAAGRVAGRRVGLSTGIGSASWQCNSYDAAGRMVSQSWPAFNGAPARTADYTFKVGGNPLVSSVTDATGTVTTTVDQLGRLVGYTDATGRTTTITFNQAGQQTATSGPQGAISNTYDSSSGNLATVTVGGTLLATTHYDTGNGRLTSVTYANGTTGTLGYDSLGTQNSLVFTDTADGTLVTGDQTVLSSARRVASEKMNIDGTALTNPNPDGPTAATYTYDGAGRIATAYLAGAKAVYGYANNAAGDNCVSPGQGANTNRTSVAVTPTGGSTSSTSYCYNTADQLVSTTTGAGTNSQYSYDAHGNQTQDRGAALTWDATDRLATTTPSGGGTTSYTYDALDRVVSHAAGGTAVRYAYAGYSDAPVATLSSSGTVLQQLVSLPGGVLATIQSDGNVWSYPDLHGNVTVTTDNTGGRRNGPITYDPWGQPQGSQTINNATGGNVLGAFGGNSKLTDTSSGITILGARAYQAAEGRFLSVDPIEGGCANNYVYVNGDPLTQNDLDGRAKCTTQIPNAVHGNGYFGSAYAGTVGGIWAVLGKHIGSGLVTSAKWSSKVGSGASAGLGAFMFNFAYAYATGGKWNYCQALIEGGIGAGIGLLFL